MKAFLIWISIVVFSACLVGLYSFVTTPTSSVLQVDSMEVSVGSDLGVESTLTEQTDLIAATKSEPEHGEPPSSDQAGDHERVASADNLSYADKRDENHIGEFIPAPGDDEDSALQLGLEGGVALSLGEFIDPISPELLEAERAYKELDQNRVAANLADTLEAGEINNTNFSDQKIVSARELGEHIPVNGSSYNASSESKLIGEFIPIDPID